MSAKMSNRMPDRMSEYLPGEMSERMPARLLEYRSNKMSDCMPDRMSEYMSERTPERLSECMSDGMSMGGDHWKKLIYAWQDNIFAGLLMMAQRNPNDFIPTRLTLLGSS